MPIQVDTGTVSMENPQQKKPVPKLIHFDVTQGCVAELLNGALLDLGLPLAPVAYAFKQLHLDHLDLKMGKHVNGQVQGSCLILGSSAGPFAQSATFDDLINHVCRCELSPIPSALVRKTLAMLRQGLQKVYGDASASLPFTGEVLVHILSQVVAFCVLIHEADPLEVTATRLPISWSFSSSPSGDVPIDEQGWLLALLEGLPTHEQEWPAAYSDPVAVALLKSVASHFGPRGESRLFKSGTGIQKDFSKPGIWARALCCEPAYIATRALLGPCAEAKTAPLVRMECLLGPNVQLQDLIRSLNALRVQKIWTSQVMEQGITPKIILNLWVSHSDSSKVMEMLLTGGEASEVSTFFVEQYALQHRTVSVPFGRGSKMQQCGVIEWLLGEEILRAEPVPADLSAIVAATGYAQEVIRGDVLAAWRKWRE